MILSFKEDKKYPVNYELVNPIRFVNKLKNSKLQILINKSLRLYLYK